MVIVVGLLFSPNLGVIDQTVGGVPVAAPPVNAPVTTNANPWVENAGVTPSGVPGTSVPLISIRYCPTMGTLIRTPSTLFVESRPAGFKADSLSPDTLTLSAVHWFP